MAFDLTSISTGHGTRPPRVVMLGVEKIGKSSFAAGAEKPIFIPIKGEEGIDGLNVPQFPAAGTFAQVKEAVSSLYEGGHDFQTVVIDSASALEPLIWNCVINRCGGKDGAPTDSIEKVLGGYAKGYTEALNEWTYLTSGLDALRTQHNMASIIIGHVKVKRFDDPNGDSYDQYQFDVNQKASNLLIRWADVIFFANTKVVVKKEDVGFNKEKNRGMDLTGGARFLYTQKRPSHPGGGRGVYGRLPYELPLSWQAFRDAVGQQMAAETAAS